VTTTVDTQRRRLTLAMLAAGMSAPALLRAQTPTQTPVDTLHILHGYPPGSSLDIVSRKLADKLGGHYADHAIVEGKSGAAGRLAVDELVRARPDGSVLLIAPASTFTLYPHVFQRLSYNVSADLAPVSVVATTAFALAVGPKVPGSVDSFAAFKQWCRANPAAAQCGNAGAGSQPHFMAVLLAREAGIDLAHIPYRGGSAAMQAAAGGEVAAALGTEASARPMEQAGKLRILATTWAGPSPFFAQAPSFTELGLPALAQREWFGALMPARTPPATVETTSQALHAALQDPDVRELWERIYLGVETSTPAQLKASIRRESDFWAQVVKASGFTPEA
jgi:tripartite-type tricarboxylate transporter receptor subunit TctC